MFGISNGRRPSQSRFILPLAAGLFVALLCGPAFAAPTAYVDEAEFHNALALMGYTATHEGFEDDTAWGSVRSSIVGGFHFAPSISSLGMTWTSNYLAGGITTGEGPVRSGKYGFYSYLHGSYQTPDPGTDCSVPGECGDGWRGTPDNGVFIAMGGYIDTNTPYAALGMFIPKYPDNPVDFGESCDEQGNNCSPNSTIGTAQEFFGVIDPDGFSAFEYRELEGKTEPPFGGDLKYIFSDDFYFVIAQPPAPTVLVSPVGGLVTTESGGTAVFDVVLSAQPTADVTLSLTSSDPGEGVVSEAEMVFTTADWGTVRTATIIGVSDGLADGNVPYSVVVSVSASADPAYAGLAPVPVSATNIDGNTACCDIVFVDHSATGANDGTNWNDAYPDLQDALSNISSGEIWVAAGSYMAGTDRADTFQLRNNVALYGGFAGTELVRGQRDPASNITTLDGDLLGDDYYRFVNGHVAWGDAADNSHHIVTGSNTDATAVLDGFVIAHGYARGSGPDPGPAIQGGGGLFIQSGSPTINNVTIDGSSGWYGGGAYVHDSSPSFSNCEFRENYGDIGRAGAIYIGGTSSVTFTNCEFKGNAAIGTQSPDGLGGAAYIDFGSTANFTGSTFIRNLTGYRTNDQGGSTATKGGAILAGGDVFVRDSYFFANKSHYGGAIYAFHGLTLIDNVFNGNKATAAPTSPSSGGLGGALMLSDISTLLGNTITANEGSENAGGIYIASGGDVLLVNNILWGNTVSKYIPPGEDQIPLSRIQLHNGGGTWDMSYGVFEGLYEEISGEDPPDPTDFPGVLDLDPLFKDDNGPDNITGNEDDDLRPGAGSPAVDSGDNSAVPVDVLTDINGDQRFQDDPATPDTGLGSAPVVDMGPYEFGSAPSVNQAPVAVPSASLLSGEAPLAIEFYSTGSYDPDGAIVSYAWIFGDGGSDSAAAPSYVYATPGNYTAYLTVTDAAGDTHTDSIGITVLAAVSNQPPVLLLSAAPTSGTTPLNVSFDGAASYDGDGTIDSYAWDFGDDSSGTGGTTNHIYTTAGNFTAILTVTDNDGATGTDSVIIDVAQGNQLNYVNADFATSSGTISSGAYDDTHASDLVYEEITEEQTKGKASKRRSRLSHTWVMNVAAGSTHKLHVKAYHSPNSESDDFAFEYSRDGVNFNSMLVVSKVTPDNTPQFYLFGENVGGTLYIRVTDTDSSQGNAQQDTLFVDEMYVETSSGGGGDVTPPAVPTGLTATPGNGNVALDWNANVEPDLAGYHIYRANQAAGPYSAITASPVPTNAYSDSTASNGTTYYYVVTALDTSNNESADSAEVNATPQGGGGTATTLHVAGITVTTVSAGKGKKRAQGQVSIRDDLGNAVEGVVVTASFTGSFNESGTATTDSNGNALITSINTAKGGVNFSLCVDDVTAGLSYASGDIVESGGFF
jgi:PKD repeat protein